MKSFLLFFTLLVPSCLLFAQKPERLKTAFYYDSLIRAGDSCNVYNYVFLASIYIRENNLRELKTTYERAMKCPLKNFYQLGFYLQLADIYLREERFRSALELITLYDSSKHKVKVHHDPTPFIHNFSLAIKRSKCYKGLGIVDSAIYELSPFVFFKHKRFEPFYDSLSYDGILKNYLTLLSSKYSATELRNELHQAEKRFYFEVNIEKEPTPVGLHLHKIICGFHFLEYPINYLDFGIYIDKQTKWSYPNDCNWDYQFKSFKESPLYTMIMTL
jgi:hypothetical protein